MRKQLCGRLWSLRNFEFLLRRLSKCWWSAQIVFSLSKKVSSVTVPGLRHSSSNMARMPFWFWHKKKRLKHSLEFVTEFYSSLWTGNHNLKLCNRALLELLWLYDLVPFSLVPDFKSTNRMLTYIFNEVTDNGIVEILDVCPFNAL